MEDPVKEEFQLQLGFNIFLEVPRHNTFYPLDFHSNSSIGMLLFY